LTTVKFVILLASYYSSLKVADIKSNWMGHKMKLGKLNSGRAVGSIKHTTDLKQYGISKELVRKSAEVRSATSKSKAGGLPA
jgi:hypothetical protein